MVRRPASRLGASTRRHFPVGTNSPGWRLARPKCLAPSVPLPIGRSRVVHVGVDLARRVQRRRCCEYSLPGIPKLPPRSLTRTGCRLIARTVMSRAATAWIVLGITSVSFCAMQQSPSPRLGAPLNAFVQRLGQPVRDLNPIYDFQKCPGRTALARWGLTVQDGRVIAIHRNACSGEKLDPTEAKREASAFFPRDATSPKPFTTGDGWPAEQRVSAILAKEFPASAFEDCRSRRVARGTFAYLLSPERRSWLIAVGMCP